MVDFFLIEGYVCENPAGTKVLSIIDVVFNFNASAVGEKHPTAARQDRLDFLYS